MSESEKDAAKAKQEVEDSTPEGHDSGDLRGGGGAGGEAGALPGMPSEERTDEKGHEARDTDGGRESGDDAPGAKGEQ